MASFEMLYCSAARKMEKAYCCLIIMSKAAER
jgi:hypothetical protein